MGIQCGKQVFVKVVFDEYINSHLHYVWVEFKWVCMGVYDCGLQYSRLACCKEDDLPCALSFLGKTLLG